MEQSVQKENKMGVMPVPKLLMQMSLPIVISMLIQALYNIVDSAFVAQINENALTAVSLVFPVQNLMIAIASGTAVGINALLSKSLGEKEFARANDAAHNGIFLALLSTIAIAVLGFFLAEPFFALQTSDPEIYSYGVTYMRLCTVLSLGIFLEITLERILQATGRTFYTMLSQGIGAITNIILDPILIFGLFGAPKLGVAGAAIATIIGQFLAMFLALFFNLKYNKDIHMSMKGFRPNAFIIGHIYAVGVPSIIMQSIGSVMTFDMNKILMAFSSTATAVFGVYFKLNSFIFMPIFGLNNGLVPIVAYNYGARRRKRITDAIKLSVAVSMAIMLIGIALFWLIPDVLLGIFNASPQMLEIGVPALRIISLSFLFAGYCIVIGSVFQALGCAVYSMIISLARQLLIILPVAAILAKLFGLTAVWWSIPIAECASLAMTTAFFLHVYKQKLKHLEQPNTMG